MTYKLIEEASGNEVKPGMTILSFRNELYKFISFRAPHKPGSTGRINVEHCDTGREQEFFPTVFGLKIVEK